MKRTVKAKETKRNPDRGFAPPAIEADRQDSSRYRREDAQCDDKGESDGAVGERIAPEDVERKR